MVAVCFPFTKIVIFLIICLMLTFKKLSSLKKTSKKQIIHHYVYLINSNSLLEQLSFWNMNGAPTLSCWMVWKRIFVITQISDVKASTHTPTCLYASQYSLGPFHIKDKMIITKAWDSSDGPGCILAPVEADEGKTLTKD